MSTLSSADKEKKDGIVYIWKNDGKGKTFSRYKRIQQFSSESIEQNWSAGFLEITYRNEINKRQIISKRFIYHERKNYQVISSILLKSSVEKFCCLHLVAHAATLFLYSRIKEYDQTTPLLIDSENIDVVVVVVMCAYAASIINGELAIRHKN